MRVAEVEVDDRPHAFRAREQSATDPDPERFEVRLDARPVLRERTDLVGGARPLGELCVVHRATSQSFEVPVRAHQLHVDADRHHCTRCHREPSGVRDVRVRLAFDPRGRAHLGAGTRVLGEPDVDVDDAAVRSIGRIAHADGVGESTRLAASRCSAARTRSGLVMRNIGGSESTSVWP